MKSEIKKVNIFIDTNILEIHNKKLMEFKFNETYDRLKKFIKYNNYHSFHIMIPKIVLEELYIHYVEEYKNIENKLENIDKGYSGFQSDISKIGYELRIEKKRYLNINEYEKYLRQNINNYILKEKDYMEIVPYPNQEKFYSIIERAIEKKRPFFSGNSNKKEFSDAGFKDVIFVESIKEKMDLEDADYIIITNDNIVNGLEWSKEIIGKNGKSTNYNTGIDIINFICQEYEINDLSEYIEFSKTDYFYEKIYNATSEKLERINNINILEQEEEIIIEVECILKNKENIIVSLDETKEFLDIRNSNGETIYQW